MTADKEEMKPCPFCLCEPETFGDHSVGCTIDECGFPSPLVDVDVWNNARCWKELSKRDAIIKAVKDALYSYHSHQHRLCICALGKSCSAASGTDFYLANQALSEIERLKKEQP